MLRGFVVVPIAFGLSLALAEAAGAQSNTLVIEQSGSDNALTVDQSDASDSSVAGLEPNRSRRSFVVQTGTETVETTTADGTVTKQEVPVYGSVSADVLGYRNADTARQAGSGNSASIRMTGDGGAARLLQDNSRGGFGDGNTASVTALNGSSVVLGQVGLANDADLNVTGALSNGTILQSGNRNIANLRVTGSGSSGFISQIGSNNNTGLTVTGNGTTAAYVLQGNGLRSAVAGGVGVTASGTTVQITQTAMPGIGAGR